MADSLLLRCVWCTCPPYWTHTPLSKALNIVLGKPLFWTLSQKLFCKNPSKVQNHKNKSFFFVSARLVLLCCFLDGDVKSYCKVQELIYFLFTKWKKRQKRELTVSWLLFVGHDDYSDVPLVFPGGLSSQFDCLL